MTQGIGGGKRVPVQVCAFNMKQVVERGGFEFDAYQEIIAVMPVGDGHGMIAYQLTAVAGVEKAALPVVYLKGRAHIQYERGIHIGHQYFPELIVVQLRLAQIQQPVADHMAGQVSGGRDVAVLTGKILLIYDFNGLHVR